MGRRTDFQAATSYKGQKLKGSFTLSYKIDGVRMLWRDSQAVTRNDKHPRGYEAALTERAKQKLEIYKDCEVYKHGWQFGQINGAMSDGKHTESVFDANDLYPLVDLDSRLFIGRYDGSELTPEFLSDMLDGAVDLGYEGLVVRGEKKWYRVKPEHTADVLITGFFEQLDKNKIPKDQLGGFTTAYGNVTAFTEELRAELWECPEQYIGKLMQVTYKERYYTGSFRYCVTFNHFVTDKDHEAFDSEPPVKG